MTQFVTPEGYAPYRLFTYDDQDVSCILRPEQFIGAAAIKPGFHESITVGDIDWAAKIVLKDGSMTLQFGFGRGAELRCRGFLNKLREFMEEEALRNAHNAVMRKGKTNG
jgi:hypothetical protein